MDVFSRGPATVRHVFPRLAGCLGALSISHSAKEAVTLDVVGPEPLICQPLFWS
jgi:hypothetical protein